jgi:hypothetical protein
MLQKIVSLLMLIAHAALNRFVCKDVLLRYLATKYVLVNGKKQDIVLDNKDSRFSGGLNKWPSRQLPTRLHILTNYSFVNLTL